MIHILSMLVARGPSVEELEAVDYTPLPGDDWKVSTPEEQGLDPTLLVELYHDASELETLHGLLVIKNGYLVKEVHTRIRTSIILKSLWILIQSSPLDKVLIIIQAEEGVTNDLSVSTSKYILQVSLRLI